MYIKKITKAKYALFIDNKEYTFDLDNWVTPFGEEEYKGKKILNLKIPDDNQGYNLVNQLINIENLILKEFGIDYVSLPIKKNNAGEFGLLRCEVENPMLTIKKGEKFSGKGRFVIWEYQGKLGISCLIK